MAEFTGKSSFEFPEALDDDLVLVHLPAGHNPSETRNALIDTMKTLPAHLRRSLTWDQGPEMASPKARTSPSTPATNWTLSPPSSTAAHARRSTGKTQPSACLDCMRTDQSTTCGNDPWNSPEPVGRHERSRLI